MTDKTLSYTGRDFDSLKQSLLDYIKTYFPTTYTDYSPESVGMMFLETVAATGDLLSFYQDRQLLETFIQHAVEKRNLYNLAYQLGYKPKVSTAANASLEIFQLLPPNVSGSPDFSYAVSIAPGMQVAAAGSGVPFLVQHPVHFSVSSSLDPTEVGVYSEVSGSVEYFYLRKQVPAISAEVKSVTYSITTANPYHSLTLEDDRILGILDMVDSQGNSWYEVDYLAQDTVFDEFKNENPSNLHYPNRWQTPYLLKIKTVPRRFVTRFENETTMKIQFGNGLVNPTATLLPGADNIGLTTLDQMANRTLNPENFLTSDSYGLLPQNTTLTVQYLVGGGVTSNTEANLIQNIETSTVDLSNTLNPSVRTVVLESVSVNNPEPATGGGDGDSSEQLRHAALASYGSQLRAVTEADYVVRALSMPARFGSVAKVHAKNEDGKIALYVLAQNGDGTLTTVNATTATNLLTFLTPYKLLTDEIAIKNAYVVNIGLSYEITVLPGHLSNVVLEACNTLLTEYFDRSKWAINQPIVLSDIYGKLATVKGVQSVINVDVQNRYGDAYSQVRYDVRNALRNRILYPSCDPCIFELKYPSDLKGRIITY